MAKFEVKAKIWAEGRFFVIKSDELGITTQGETAAEARENFIDALKLSLKDPDFKKRIEAKYGFGSAKSFDAKVELVGNVVEAPRNFGFRINQAVR